MSEQINWEKLSHRDILEDTSFKSIVLFHPLKLDAELLNKRITITDDGLQLNSMEEEKNVISEFRDFLNNQWKLPYHSEFFVINKFRTPKKEEFAFELEERARYLCVAIKILTGKRCFTSANFNYDDSKDPVKYYTPFISEDTLRKMVTDREISVISTEKEFKILKNIYNKIFELKIFKYDHRFSKIINAVRFYERIENDTWFLQKIAYSFICLESLFTDKSSSEVTYKVSIRTAYFLYPYDPSSRREIFYLLKIAYDIRSSFLHGSKVDEVKFNQKLKKLKNNTDYSLWFDLANDLNNILSDVLRKIFMDEKNLSFFSGKSNENDEIEFYNKLVLDP